MKEFLKEATRQQFIEFVTKASTDEIYYLLGAYGGPHKTILREKEFSREVCQDFNRILNREVANREMDAILTDTFLSDD